MHQSATADAPGNVRTSHRHAGGEDRRGAHERPKTQLGSRSCGRLPCRRTSIRLANEPKLTAAPSGFGGSLHPCCSEERRQVSRFCSVARPEGQRNSAVLRPSRHPKTPFASPAPRTGPKAIPFRGCPGRSSSEDAPFRRLAPLDSPEGAPSIAICSTPKARRLSESRIRSIGLIQRSTRLHGSVVGAGRDHPKSLSIPDHRRPTKTMAEAVLFVLVTPGTFPVAPFDGLDRRLAVATDDLPSEDIRSSAGHQKHCPTVSLARSYRAQRGLMSHLRNHRPFLAVGVCFSKLKSLNFLPISRRTALVPDVMKLSSNPIRAKR